MKLVLFGATGMVGAGTLLEALDDPRVGRVLTVGRRATGVRFKAAYMFRPGYIQPMRGVRSTTRPARILEGRDINQAGDAP